MIILLKVSASYNFYNYNNPVLYLLFFLDQKEKIMKITLDNISYKRKPNQLEVSQIQTRFKKQNSVVNVSIDELFDLISQGKTIVPAVMQGGIKKENFIEQQLIMLDIDNHGDDTLITLEETLKKLEDSNIEVLGYYYTFSSTDTKPSFRILILLDKPIKNINQLEFALEILIDLTNADPACKNCSRIFFGTNGKEKKVTILNKEAIVTFEQIEKLYKVNSNKQKNDEQDSELHDLISNFDTLEYIKQYAEITRDIGNVVYFEKRCPICGHNNCFRFFKDSNMFRCFGSSGSISGNIITFIMETKKISKKEAIDYFKYEILKIPRKNKNELLEQQNLLIVKQQLNENSFDSEILTTLPWMQPEFKNNKLTYKVCCPILANYIRKNLKYIFVRNNAKGGVLRYIYRDGYYKLSNDDEFKGLIKSLIPLQYQKMKDITEVLNLLYTDFRFISMDELNNNENIINFNNGLLYLDTMELKEHTPEFFCTIRIPCNYIENCPSPVTNYFNNYINDLTDNNEEIKLLLLEFMGVALSNVKGHRMKKALFLIGAPDSGKSKIKEFLQKLIGEENCSNIELKNFEQQFGKIALLNKRLVGSNDLSYMSINELNVFKQATGGDQISAEFKHENIIDFVFNGVLWFCGNQMPKFSGDKGDHVYNRMIIIESKKSTPIEKQDVKLVEHLLLEKDYIISLSIKALQRVLNNGYKYDIPQICQNLTKQYKIENDSFLKFYDECLIERDPNLKIKDLCTTGRIFKVYQLYCRDNNNGYYNKKSEVKEMLKKLGKDEIVPGLDNNRYYKYLTLRPETIKEYEEIFEGKNYSIEEYIEDINYQGTYTLDLNIEDDLPF